MSNLRPLPSLPDTLQHIQERLRQGLVPQQVIEELLPLTRTDAVTWTRRLSAWEEYGEQFPAQVVALARIVSLLAMRAFGLSLSEDGRVVERLREGKPGRTPKPSLTFLLAVGGEEVRVEYTRDYFPCGGKDYFYFVSPQTPPAPHPLSATGYLSQFVLHDAVEACGGPKAYAAMFAEARLRGEEEVFKAMFEGTGSEAKQPRRRKAFPSASLPRSGEQLPVIGEHTAQVIAEQEDKKATGQPPRERTLYDEMP
jgi:hypothetical protein